MSIVHCTIFHGDGSVSRLRSQLDIDNFVMNYSSLQPDERPINTMVFIISTSRGVEAYKELPNCEYICENNYLDDFYRNVKFETFRIETVGYCGLLRHEETYPLLKSLV
jgi:hypothetical protein